MCISLGFCGVSSTVTTMGLGLGVWRIDDRLEEVELGEMPSEEQLEELLHKNPSILGEPLLIVGRQVGTSTGKRIDLLAIDSEGVLRVLELKKGRAPRYAVAQVLEYGAWVQTLSHDNVLNIFAQKNLVPFEEAFEDTFGFAPPEELNTGHKLSLIATAIDKDSEQIIEYLDSIYGVPINAIFFRYFRDGDKEYIARNYLIDETQEPVRKSGGATRTREAWNGNDWYVSFDRPWDDARKLGYVSAGGGDWYANTIKQVPQGARVWVYAPKTGYIGVGIVTGEAQVFKDSHISEAENLEWDMQHANGEPEWILPLKWIKTVDLEDALWKKGMFANQNSACKLRNSFTLDELSAGFGIDESSLGDNEPISTIDSHRDSIDNEDLRDAFDSIVEETARLGLNVTIAPRKFYIAFKTVRNFASLETQRKKILIFLHLDPNEFSNQSTLGSRDVRRIGHFGTGDLEIQVTSSRDVPEAMALIRRAFGDHLATDGAAP